MTQKNRSRGRSRRRSYRLRGGVTDKWKQYAPGYNSYLHGNLNQNSPIENITYYYPNGTIINPKTIAAPAPAPAPATVTTAAPATVTTAAPATVTMAAPAPTPAQVPITSVPTPVMVPTGIVAQRIANINKKARGRRGKGPQITLPVVAPPPPPPITPPPSIPSFSKSPFMNLPILNENERQVMSRLISELTNFGFDRTDKQDQEYLKTIIGILVSQQIPKGVHAHLQQIENTKTNKNFGKLIIFLNRILNTVSSSATPLERLNHAVEIVSTPTPSVAQPLSKIPKSDTLFNTNERLSITKQANINRIGKDNMIIQLDTLRRSIYNLLPLSYSKEERSDLSAIIAYALFVESSKYDEGRKIQLFALLDPILTSLKLDELNNHIRRRLTEDEYKNQSFDTKMQDAELIIGLASVAQQHTIPENTKLVKPPVPVVPNTGLVARPQPGAGVFPTPPVLPAPKPAPTPPAPAPTAPAPAPTAPAPAPKPAPPPKTKITLITPTNLQAKYANNSFFHGFAFDPIDFNHLINTMHIDRDPIFYGINRVPLVKNSEGTYSNSLGQTTEGDGAELQIWYKLLVRSPFDEFENWSIYDQYNFWDKFKELWEYWTNIIIEKRRTDRYLTDDLSEQLRFINVFRLQINNDEYNQVVGHLNTIIRLIGNSVEWPRAIAHIRRGPIPQYINTVLSRLRPTLKPLNNAVAGASAPKNMSDIVAVFTAGDKKDYYGDVVTYMFDPEKKSANFNVSNIRNRASNTDFKVRETALLYIKVSDYNIGTIARITPPASARAINLTNLSPTSEPLHFLITNDRIIDIHPQLMFLINKYQPALIRALFNGAMIPPIMNTTVNDQNKDLFNMTWFAVCHAIANSMPENDMVEFYKDQNKIRILDQIEGRYHTLYTSGLSGRQFIKPISMYQKWASNGLTLDLDGFLIMLRRPVTVPTSVTMPTSVTVPTSAATGRPLLTRTRSLPIIPATTPQIPTLIPLGGTGAPPSIITAPVYPSPVPSAPTANYNIIDTIAPKRFSLDIIRHGFSCANLEKGIVQKTKGLAKIGAQLSRAFKTTAEGKDPVLANIGLVQALQLRNTLKNTQYENVFVSYLRRTIETALIVFGRSEVVLRFFPELDTVAYRNSIVPRTNYPSIRVIPYISEERAFGSLDIENESIGLAALKEWYASKSAANMTNNPVDFAILEGRDPETKSKPNISLFLETIYPLLEDGHKYALVSHAYVMRSLHSTITNSAEYPLGPSSPLNTELWPLNVEYTPGTSPIISYSGPPIKPPPRLAITYDMVDPSDKDQMRRFGARCTVTRSLKGGRHVRKTRRR